MDAPCLSYHFDSKWAAAHAIALKTGGKLLMLVFPLRPAGNDSQDGPPVSDISLFIA
jgi:hypothetical protein